jgi:flagellar biosynthesis protein FliR
MELHGSLPEIAAGAAPILARTTALAFTLPLFSSGVVPFMVRFGIAGGLALPVLLLVGDSAQGVSFMPGAGWWLMLVHEGLVGAMMGLAASAVLGAARLVGSLIDGMFGISIGGFADGSVAEESGVTGSIFWWTTAAVFIASGGASVMLGGIMDSFRQIPPGAAVFDSEMLQFLTNALGNAFSFALRASLPAVAAMLVAAAILGMVQRCCPQIAGMQTGLGLTVIAGLMLTSLLLLTTPWIISQGMDDLWPALFENMATTGEAVRP